MTLSASASALVPVLPASLARSLARSFLTLPCCALRHYCCLSLRAPSNSPLALLLLFCRTLLQFIQSSQSLQKNFKKKDLEKLLESIATNVFMMMKRTEGGKERREDSTSPPGSKRREETKDGGKKVTHRDRNKRKERDARARTHAQPAIEKEKRREEGEGSYQKLGKGEERERV